MKKTIKIRWRKPSMAKCEQTVQLLFRGACSGDQQKLKVC